MAQEIRSESGQDGSLMRFFGRVPVPRSATVYDRLGVYYVVSMNRTKSGFFVYGAHRVLPTGTSRQQVAEAVLWALDESHLVRDPRIDRTPNPLMNDHRKNFPPLIDAGVRWYSQFLKGARSVSVTQRAESISVTPQHNTGKHSTPLLEQERSLSADLTAAELATAIFDALDDCTGS